MIRTCAAAAALLSSVPAAAGYIDHFATSEDIGIDKAPHRGVSAILVLPLIVSESNLPPKAALLDAAAAFFHPTAQGFTFANYFKKASLARYTAVPTLVDPVVFDTCPFGRDANHRCTILRGDVSALAPAIAALKQTLDAADSWVDYGEYDLNGAEPGTSDGVVDGIVILTNINFGGIALPHYRICDGGLTGIACWLAGVIDWNALYDGVMVPWVAVAGLPQDANGAYNPERANYIAVHEFGHQLGFADLYDEGDSSTDLPYSVMGGWTYNDKPHLPDAFSRYVIGWGNAVQAQGDTTAVLRPAHSSGDVLKLGVGNEYFLVEYRQPQGVYDGDISPAGVAIYHVNLAKRPSPAEDSFLTTIAMCVNCSVWQPMLMLEQADGKFELQQGPDHRDDAGDLFHPGESFPAANSGPPLSSATAAFNSNLYDGTATGIALTVTSIGDVAVVQVKHPPFPDACTDLLCPEGATCDDAVCVFPGEVMPPTPDDPPTIPGDDNNTAATPPSADPDAPDPITPQPTGSPADEPAVSDGGCSATPPALGLVAVFVFRRRRRP